MDNDKDLSTDTDSMINPDSDRENTVIPFDEKVRVLIMNSGYNGIYHTELRIICSDGITVNDNGKILNYEPDSEYILNIKNLKGMVSINGKNNGKLHITNLGRSSDALYRGSLECYPAAQGMVVINELPVEEYLYRVLPSEMPPTYPDEALKAQAISARTYTYFHKQRYAYPEWRAHMDDSTSFQVYGNCEESERAEYAVNETRGQILTYEDSVVECFYYSTSGGYNGGAEVWKDKAEPQDGYLTETGEEIYASGGDEGEQAYRQYIDNGNPEDVEYDEAWYRWNYHRTFDSATVRNTLEKLYNLSVSQPNKVRIRSQYLSSDKIKDETDIKDIRILKRRKSGLVTGIMIETEHFRISVMSQNSVRQILGNDNDIIIRKDGSTYKMGSTLPSAYFYIEGIYDNNEKKGNNLKQIIIHGTGFGHGCGMSQNGAKRLAERGLTAESILAYYYNGSIKAVSEINKAVN